MSKYQWALTAAVLFLACAVVGSAGAESIKYLYNSDGSIQKAIYSTKAIRYTYDASGNRLTQAIASSASSISASPASLAFGAVSAGATSAPQTVTIANSGEVPLTIQGIAVAGTNSAEFAKQADTCSGQTLPAGASCTVSAVFQPTGSAGAKSADLSVASNAANAPTLNIALSGIAECAYAISPITATYSFAAASGSVAVTTQSGCTWEAQSPIGWIAFVNGTNRNGSGSVSYNVSANQSTIARNAGVVIAGQNFSITQAGEPCTYSVTPATVHGNANASTASVAVTSNYSACGWNVQNLPDWITANPASGNGSGSVTLTMTPNPDAALRSAVVTIGGQAVTVQQWGTAEVTDMLFRNTATGEIVIWLLDGATRTASVSLGVVAPEWQVAGRGDFNGDGKADIVLRNTATGANTVWYMDGSVKTGTAAVSSVGTQWSIIDVGDMNSDGKPDILWRDTTTGQAVIWFMDGVSRTGFASIGAPALEWNFFDRADFNGDGKPDIFWRNGTTLQNSVWYMDAEIHTGSAGIPFAAEPWTIAGLGDFNGDGKPDILWRNPTTGANIVWYMDGVTRTGWANAPAVALPWTIAGLGDFNGDGKPDILWRNSTTGQIAIWFMDGVTRTGSAGLGAVAAEWQIMGR